MTIEEAIKDIELTCEYLKNIGVFDNPTNEKCKPSLNMAIDIMRKYQKIKDIVKNNNGFTDGTLEHSKAFTKIVKVVEDGNVD